MPLYGPGASDVPLAMLTLGVVGDDRPMPDLQPALREGIHLRWGFKRDSDPNNAGQNRAFPWYGFYLFRRLTPTGGATTCAASQFTGLTPGTLSSTSLAVPLGTFVSDQNIVLTNQFAPSGTVELDLSGRTSVIFQMPPTAPKRSVSVKIGFTADFPPAGGGTGTPGTPGGGPGGGLGPDPGGGPGTGGGGPFVPPGGPGGGLGPDPGGGPGTGGGGPGPSGGPGPGGGPPGGLGGGAGGNPLACACGCGTSATIQPILERVIPLGNGNYRATFGYNNSSHTSISIPIGPQNSFSPSPASRGQPTLFLPGLHHGAFSVVFTGGPLYWTVGGASTVASSVGASAPTTSDGILVIALRTGFPVGFRVVSGLAGDVVTTSISFEAIDTVLITSGPARLIDVCAIDASDSANLGWAAAPNFPQPMLLPVRHDDYPLRTGTPSQSESESLAVNRISYAFPIPGTVPPQLDTSQWQGDANFGELHQMLLDIVNQGPSKGLMDHIEDVTADPDPDDPSVTAAVSSAQSWLDVMLVGASNPAVAQMLGLYWVDDTTVEGQSYDYMVVADNTNAGGGGNVSTILSLVTAGNYANLEAYKCEGVVRSRPMLLAPPTSVDAYSLPVGAVAPPTPADAAGLVGLRWPITGATEAARLLSTNAILYHTWRRDLGTADPGTTPITSGFSRVTDVPRATGTLRLSPPDQPLTGWPTFGLYSVDGPLMEGWYAYAVNGIDVFGRFSGLSPSAVWRNVDSNAVQNSVAVNLLDLTPPPAPTRVQAWVLDPQDVFLTKDAAYTTWRNALIASDPVNGPKIIGLRVRWSWPSKAILQAPDAAEFRVYIQPGAFPTPADPNIAVATVETNWAQRIAIVGMGERIVVDGSVSVKNGGGVALSGANATVPMPAFDPGAPVDNTPVDVTLADAPDLSGVVVEGLELELAGTPGGATRFTVVGLESDGEDGQALSATGAEPGPALGLDAVPRAHLRALPPWNDAGGSARVDVAHHAIADDAGGARACRRDRRGQQAGQSAPTRPPRRPRQPWSVRSPSGQREHGRRPGRSVPGMADTAARAIDPVLAVKASRHARRLQEPVVLHPPPSEVGKSDHRCRPGARSDAFSARRRSLVGHAEPGGRRDHPRQPRVADRQQSAGHRPVPGRCKPGARAAGERLRHFD